MKRMQFSAGILKLVFLSGMISTAGNLQFIRNSLKNEITYRYIRKIIYINASEVNCYLEEEN